MAETRLGRGLDFLISRTRIPPAEAGGAATEQDGVSSHPHSPGPESRPFPTSLPLDSISPNPFQPRRDFTPEALAELMESIRRHGVLQPVVVRTVGEGYQLVAGERRYRASRELGLVSIPAVMRGVSDEEMLALALVENLQREDLNPIETAHAYRQLLDTTGSSQEDVAGAVGKSRTAVSNTIRLLDLPEDLQDHVSRGTLSAGHGRALLMAGDQERMVDLAARILAEGLSVRETEALASGATAGPPQVLRAVRPPKERSSHLDELEGQLRNSLGTRAVIKPGRGKKGKIVLHYASLEEFDRIFEILTGPVEAAPAAREAV